MSNREVRALVKKIQKMETVYEEDDREVYRDQDGKLYEIDFDGTVVIAIYVIDDEFEVLETIYYNEQF